MFESLKQLVDGSGFNFARIFYIFWISPCSKTWTSPLLLVRGGSCLRCPSLVPTNMFPSHPFHLPCLMGYNVLVFFFFLSCSKFVEFFTCFYLLYLTFLLTIKLFKTRYSGRVSFQYKYYLRHLLLEMAYWELDYLSERRKCLAPVRPLTRY